MSRLSLAGRALRVGVGGLVLAAALGGAGAAATPIAHESSAGTICSQLRREQGTLRLAAGRRSLRILATGDSMIYPIDEELSLHRPAGMRVIDSRHDGTGLTTATVDWRALSAHQSAHLRPDVTVISLGGRDGGIPLPDAQHVLVGCCGPKWLALYADRVRPLVQAYLRGGRGRVYWLLLPAPRETLRAPFFAAVNEAIALLAREYPGELRPLPVDATISPGGYQETITYGGLQIHPRAPDGIHLDHAGACVERSLVMEALLQEGLLRR